MLNILFIQLALNWRSFFFFFFNSFAPYTPVYGASRVWCKRVGEEEKKRTFWEKKSKQTENLATLQTLWMSFGNKLCWPKHKLSCAVGIAKVMFGRVSLCFAFDKFTDDDYEAFSCSLALEIGTLSSNSESYMFFYYFYSRLIYTFSEIRCIAEVQV